MLVKISVTSAPGRSRPYEVKRNHLVLYCRKLIRCCPLDMRPGEWRSRSPISDGGRTWLLCSLPVTWVHRWMKIMEQEARVSEGIEDTNTHTHTHSDMTLLSSIFHQGTGRSLKISSIYFLMRKILLHI